MNRLLRRMLSLLVTLALVTNSFFFGDPALSVSRALAQDEQVTPHVQDDENSLDNTPDPPDTTDSMIPVDDPADSSSTDGDGEDVAGGIDNTGDDSGANEADASSQNEENASEDGSVNEGELIDGDGSVADATDTAQETEDGAARKKEEQKEAEEAAKAEADDKADVAPEQVSTPTVGVLTHVQRVGWAKSWVSNGGEAGTTGRALRLEAIRLRLENLGNLSGSIQYRTHIQTVGWRDWVSGDAMSGSTGMSRRVEAIQIQLAGDIAKDYDVYYRLHVQRLGWMAWARNGETAGSVGKSMRAEAIQVALVKHGDAAPSTAGQSYNSSFYGDQCVSVTAHVQHFGWMGTVYNGQVAGTTGKGLRLEAVRASLSGAKVPGDVQVAAHVQGIGWQGWVGGGQVAGTTGQSRRAEAFKMRLTGEAASAYDLYYRVHVQKLGWLAWAREGEVAGTEGMWLRAEAIQTMLVPEGAAAPSNAGSNYALPSVSSVSIGTSSYVSGSWQSYAWNGNTSGTTGRSIPNQGLKIYLSGTSAQALGGVSYRVHTQGGAWQAWTSNGSEAGTGSRIDAFQIQLSGTAAKVYNVYYRAHVQTYGWMGWACNGQVAGTTGLNKRLEAVQVMLVSKTCGAPGSTTGYYLDGSMRVGLDAAGGQRSVTPFGGYQPSSGIRNNINNAINGIRGRGYDVGFIMMDLTSHKGIAYNCDALFYGASSIKGPYLASVVNKFPDAVWRYSHDMTETLYYSWDYNYKNVLAAYGKGPMYTFCSEAGVRQSIADQLPWVNYSARELAKLWARSYQLFLQSGAGEQLGRWCENPNVSTIHSTLGGKYRTRSKAGWIDDGEATRVSGVNGGGPLYKVSDDGGIVYAHNGTYVMAIMSSVPADHDMLNGLTAAIDAAHSQM